MWTLQFWKDLLERALKTGAQFILVAVGGNLTDLWNIDWKVVVGVAGAGTLSSVLMSLGSNILPLGNDGTASLTKAVEPSTPVELHVPKHEKEDPPIL